MKTNREIFNNLESKINEKNKNLKTKRESDFIEHFNKIIKGYLSLLKNKNQQSFNDLFLKENNRLFFMMIAEIN